MSFSIAQAGETIKIEASGLKIMGKGIEDRRTKEMLVLACDPLEQNNDQDECKSLRFVYFDQAGDAYSVGNAIAMPDKDSVRLEKRAIQREVRHYLNTHETQQSILRKENYSRKVFFSGLTIGFYLGLGVEGLILSNAAAAIVVIGIPVGLLILLNERVMNSFTGLKLDARVMDQGSWNWSADPQYVSHNKFQSVLSQVLSKENREYN